MFVRVDTEEAKKDIEGFSYKNSDGDMEYVIAGDCTVTMLDYLEERLSEVYIDDIPFMIKALQAAYNRQKGI